MTHHPVGPADLIALGPGEPGAVPPRPAAVRPWRGLRRVLVVRLDAAGDVLMMTPALRALRAAVADHLALLTSPSGATVAGLLPEIDATIVHEAPWMKPDLASADAAGDLVLVERLRAERFDGAVILTTHSQSPLPAALLCHLAGIPRRLAHCRENPYGLLTDWVPDHEVVAPARHEVRRQLDLLAAVGIDAADEHLSVRVPDIASRAVRARLDGMGIDAARPWVVVHPGASAPSRRYPPERYAAVLRSLRVRTGWPVVLTGDATEAGLIDEIRVLSGGIGTSLAGRLSFAELAALIAIAPLMLSNNTGPAHLAAAVGTPIVVLYALTNLQHTPWMVPARVVSVDVPCRGCRRSVCPLGHNRCLHAVEPATVVDALLDLATEVGLEAGTGPAGGAGRPVATPDPAVAAG